MSDDLKKYAFPTETLPGLDMSEHLSDLNKIADFLESLDIQTKNTRIARYTEYLEKTVNEETINESLIFKHSDDGPFETKGDWFLYVLREIHELMWILKGLKVHLPKGLEEKVKLIVGGKDFAALDSNSHSRNIQFELRIASYFCQAGFDVDLSKKTDVVAVSESKRFT